MFTIKQRHRIGARMVERVVSSHCTLEAARDVLARLPVGKGFYVQFPLK